MTVLEMHREIKIYLDKIDSLSLPEILPTELDTYLNEAQMRFIKTRYGQNNVYAQGFEQSQKRTDDLKNVIVSRYAQVSPYEYEVTNGYSVYMVLLHSFLESQNGERTVSLDKYMFHIKSSAQITKGSCTRWTRVNLVQLDDADNDNDPFNRPKEHDPKIYFEEGNIVIKVPSSVTVTDYLITFVKEPRLMYSGLYPKTGYTVNTQVNCELSEHTHKELVQMVVTMILENLGSPRSQTQVAINENRIE